MKSFLQLVIVAFVFASSLVAQTPTELTKSHFEAANAQDYTKLCKMLAPSELAEFRKGFKFIEELPAAKTEPVRHRFFGPDATVDILKNLSDVQFMVLFMETMIKSVPGGAVKFREVEIGEERIEGDLVVVPVSYKEVVADKATDKKEDSRFKKVDGKWMQVLPDGLKKLPVLIGESLKG